MDKIFSKLKDVFDYADESLSSMNKQFKSERIRLKSFAESRLVESNKEAKKTRGDVNSFDLSLNISKKKKLVDESKPDEESTEIIDANISLNKSEETFFFKDSKNNNKIPQAPKQLVKATKRNNADDTPVTTKAFASCDEASSAASRLRPKKLMDITNQGKKNVSDSSDCCFNVPPPAMASVSKCVTFDDITTDGEEDDDPVLRKKLTTFPWWTNEKHLKVLLNHQRYLNEEVVDTLFCNKSTDIESLRSLFHSFDASKLFETSGK